MGALIMTHSDNNGLVLPPALAPIQAVLVPIYKGEEELAQMVERLQTLKTALEAKGISAKIDARDNVRSGFKFAEWELKGVPVRLALGPRDMQNGTIETARRDTLEKQVIPQAGAAEFVERLLPEIQRNIYQKALDFREKNTFIVDSYSEFKQRIEDGGFFLCHWDGTAETEEKIKEETKATIRCIPLDAPKEPGACMVTGKPSEQRVVFARAY
jgi:prolyl-tRNA synthetase